MLALRFATALLLATALAALPLGGARAQDAGAIGVEDGLFGTLDPPLRAARDPRVVVPVRGQVQAPVLAPVRVPVTRLAPPPPAPEPVRRARPEEADPFAPLGLRLGVLTLRPSLTQSVGIDSNPERLTAGGRATAFSRTEGALALETDWSRHALAIEARGRADLFRGATDPRASGEAGARLRLDIREWLDLTLDARAATARERAGTPELPGDVARGPQVTSVEGAATLAARGAHASLSLRGALTRTINGDARRADGTRLSRREADYLEPALALRAGYLVGPGFEPFVEAQIDERRYVERSAAETRESRGLTGRVGARIAASALLSGEASVGWQRRSFLAPGRADVDGPVAQAALIWSPTPLTRVSLSGESAIAETRVAGATSAQALSASLGISHELTRALVLDATIGLARTDYRGAALTEDLLTASAGLEWRLSRTLAVTARYSHERLRSSAPGAGYGADIGLVGLRLAR